VPTHGSAGGAVNLGSVGLGMPSLRVGTSQIYVTDGEQR
jgi:hypothetical protein